MTIRKKILLGLALMAAIGMLLGIVGLTSSVMLTNMSRDLHDLQIESAGVTGVLNAHYIWRHGLTEFVLAGTEFTGSLDPHTCALGRWSESEAAQSITDPEILSLLNQINEPHDFIHHEAGIVVQAMESGLPEEAAMHLINAILPRTQEVITILSDMEQRYSVMIEDKGVEIENLGAFMNIVIIAFIIAALIACALLAQLITGSIVRPLIPLVAFMTKAGTTGDITLTPEDIEIISKISGVRDEIGQTIAASAGFVKHVTEISNGLSIIANNDISINVEVLSDKDILGLSLQKMTDSLNGMFGEINVATGQVSSGSRQIADSAQALAQGATEQAATVEELSASISEVGEKTKHNAEMAARASTMTDTIMRNAEKGSRQMDEMMSAVNEINQASQSISRVIKVIDDIAFQTNILALNAAVEAARAGQHGKGFAVVAEEVRNLAAKSAEAAKDTGELIANSMEKAELGARIAKETAESLAEIVSGIGENHKISIDIAASSGEQSASIAHINDGIGQVAQVVQQNSATAEESAAASEEMSGQSQMLEEMISRFKLRNSVGAPPSYANMNYPEQPSGSGRTGFSLAGGAGGRDKYYV